MLGITLVGQLDECPRGFILAGIQNDDTKIVHVGYRRVRLHAFFHQSLVLVTTDACRQRNSAIPLPTMHFEIVGNAADGVDLTVQQIAHAVAVKIHRIAPIAAGYELWNSHGARIGSFHLRHIEALLLREYQKLLELRAKEFAAFRIAECQGRQGVQHQVLSLACPVEGFDADDSDDDFGRNPVLPGRAGERVSMRAPEFLALGDARLGQKYRLILIPVQ